MKLTTQKNKQWILQRPSLLVLGITLIVLSVLIAASAFACRMHWALGFIITTISVVTTVLCLLACPLRMKLDLEQNELIVGYLLHTKRYVLTAYEVQPVQRKEVILSLRLFGSGGYFGFLGYFSHSRLGQYYCSVTHTNALIALTSRTTGRKIVLNLSKGIEFSAI